MRSPLRLAGAWSLLGLCVVMSGRLVAADRRENERSIAAAEKSGLQIKNDAPKLLFAEQSSILILIDGEPVYRPVQGTDLERIINTKPFIVRDTAGLHYMKVFDGWMEAYMLRGLWSVSGVAPRGVDQALQQAVAEKTVDLLDGAIPGKPGEAPTLDDATAPAIFIATEPAELIVTDGPPRFVALDRTPLEYVENTTANVFKEPTDDEFYVLTAGRWFRAWTLDGPWEFVSSRELPADIAAIPDSSPKASVKASIAGTTQARDALTANAVPEKTKINRHQTRLTPPLIDGDPKLQPIEGTGLSYVVNSPTPIIAPNPAAEYYALEDGVWFVGASIGGPWSVAASIPPAVYTIPPSSPLHYVTYVRIDGATADEVSVGYTPGYLGTVVGDGVVVYGTGYDYPAWIGTRWWGRPMTYGIGANLTYQASSSWTFGFGLGWNASPHGWGSGVSPWWGPLGWGRNGERYPWVWQGIHAVRTPSRSDDDRRVGAWRLLPVKNIYDRWRTAGS
jgi:hypothetical protein